MVPLAIFSLDAIFCLCNHREDEQQEAIGGANMALSNAAFSSIFSYTLRKMLYSLHRKRCLINGDIGGVTSASARCHSTVANSPGEVAPCRCSTLYVPDKSSSAADCI